MKWVVCSLALIGALIIALVIYAVIGLSTPASFSNIDGIDNLYRRANTGSHGVIAQYAGVATLLFDDGETRWMTDGFFSRPGQLNVFFGKLGPDPAAVEKGLAALEVTMLAAVIPVHSHYDHAMDSPLVAQRTGAMLLGSSSTMMIARGQGLAPEQLHEVAPGEAVQLGKFTVHFIASRHGVTLFNDGLTPETIDSPLPNPSRALDYRLGTAWSLLVEHQAGSSFLIQGSAGVVPGNLAGKHADTVFLGIGALGQQSLETIEAYWKETVLAVGAKLVILIHWDDFTRPLGEHHALRPMPVLLDKVDVAIAMLSKLAKRDGVRLELPSAYVPFAVLPADPP